VACRWQPWPSTSRPTRLAGLELPCLVMAGGASPAWMRASAAEVARAIPRSRYVVLPGQTHQAAPQLLAEQLLEFLAPVSVSEG